METMSARPPPALLQQPEHRGLVGKRTAVDMSRCTVLRARKGVAACDQCLVPEATVCGGSLQLRRSLRLGLATGVQSPRPIVRALSTDIQNAAVSFPRGFQILPALEQLIITGHRLWRASLSAIGTMPRAHRPRASESSLDSTLLCLSSVFKTRIYYRYQYFGTNLLCEPLRFSWSCVKLATETRLGADPAAEPVGGDPRWKLWNCM